MSKSILTQLEHKAREQFNAYIRLRDKDKACIYCGGKQINPNAAHYFSKNQFSGYMFNPDNVFGACEICNNLDDQTLIRENMVLRIGLERVENLEENANSKRMYKFARFELVDIVEIYKSKIKELHAAA